jgi:type VI protein secretion system component Hcp
MDTDHGDLLMMLVDDSGNPIRGASQTAFKNWMLGTGFTAGFVMEINSFGLRCGTTGEEPGTKKVVPPTEVQNMTATRVETEEERRNSIGQQSKMGGYQAWRAGTSGNYRYPLDIQPITVERPADLSSAQLIQGCIDKTTFNSAAIIKRKPMGTPFAGEIYLRFDFTGVLINKVEWSDEDNLIKEKLSFIARAITFSYRAQTASGSLGAIIKNTWQMTVGT